MPTDHPLDVRLLVWLRDHALGSPAFTSMGPRRRIQRGISDYGWARVLGGRWNRTRGIWWFVRRLTQ